MTEQDPTAIIIRPNVLPSTAQFQMMRELAERLSYAEGFLPDHFFKGDPATRKHRILAAIEYGRAVGIEPMIALQNISMINGKAGASALLIGALLRKGGYEPQKPVYSDNETKCEVTVTKNGKVMSVGKYSIEDARKAGLLRSGGGWEKNPRDMLYARALTQAARQGAQDAVLGMAYTAEELGVETDEDGQASGEIAFDKASAESVAALQAEQVNRQAVKAMGPPAPPQEAQGSDLRQSGGSDSPPSTVIQEPAAAVTPAPPGAVGVDTPVSAAATSTKGGQSSRPPQASGSAGAPAVAQTRSGPRAKRGNVVTAPVTTPGPNEVGNRIQVALDAPLDGQEQYLDELRRQARQAAAVIRHLQVKRENLFKSEQIKLGTATAQNLPALTPNLEADDSLRQFVAKRYPGRQLVDLGEAELDGSDDAPGVLRALQSIIDALHAKGFHE